MSGTHINKIINYTKKILDKTTECTSETAYYKLIKDTYNVVQDKYPEVTIQLMNDIINILFNKTFVKDNTSTYNYFPEYPELLPSIVIPPEYQHMEDHFQKLKALPQPEQRTKAWFDYRHNRITASDTAAAIDENPYEPVESFLLKKCDPNFEFLDNANVYHGKKFELIATKIYEHIYNAEVVEFGALPSEQHELLGASPDGICSARTLDNKFSSRIGTMLEIKCVAPKGRTIETSGNIKGHICPYYYYLQVQQQLECCELEVCDFWQCKLTEYNSREAYLIDNCSLLTGYTYGTKAKKITIDDKIKKGILFQFYPKEFKPQFDGDNIEWKSKFIYPPRLDMTTQQYDEFIAKTMSELNTKHKELVEEYYFHKIIYWKLEQSHNQPIERDRKLFASILPILKQSWARVEYYRAHPEELASLKTIVDKRKKYIKTDTSFIINNEHIKNKVLFLQDSNSKTNQAGPAKIPVSKKLKNHVDCDFIEDTPCDFIEVESTKPVETKPVKKAKYSKISKDESDKEDNGSYFKTKLLKKPSVIASIETSSFFSRKKNEITLEKKQSFSPNEVDCDFID